MAVTLITNGVDTGTSSTYDTASVSPVANRFYVLFVENRKQTSGNYSANTTVSGAGLTWTEIIAQGLDGQGRDTDIYAFGGISASPSSGVITITTSEDSRACSWCLLEVDDPDGSTTASIVPQSVGDSPGVNQDSLTLTLAGFQDAGNYTFVMGIKGTNTGDVSLEGTYTEDVANQSAEDVLCTFGHLAGADTSVVISLDESQRVGGIALEVKKAAGGGGGLSIPVAMGHYREQRST